MYSRCVLWNGQDEEAEKATRGGKRADKPEQPPPRGTLNKSSGDEWTCHIPRPNARTQDTLVFASLF